MESVSGRKAAVGILARCYREKQLPKPQRVIRFFKNADTVGNGRIVFNITHNKYRLIAKFEYERQLVFVRFIGSHKDYDKITDIKNIRRSQIMKALAINLDEITIKPITNQADFEEASKVINALLDADLLEDEAERKKALDILEAITVLAIDYEKKHYPMPKPDPIEAIKERMEQLHLTRKDKNLGIPAETLLAAS